MHSINDPVVLTQTLCLGGFIQEMQGGHCELHVQINLDILIWNQIQYEGNQWENYKKIWIVIEINVVNLTNFSISESHVLSLSQSV